MKIDSKKIEIPHASPYAKILYEESRHCVLYGGRGSGKSHDAGGAIVNYTFKYPIRVLCCRSIQKSIKESAYRLIKDKIYSLGLEDHYEFLKDEIRGHNGSLILFYGTKTNPEKVKSTENISICWFEEAQTISQEELDLLIPTIRARGSFFIWTFNPSLPSDPISKMFLGDSKPPKTLIKKVNYYDNRFCPQELINEAEYDKENDYEKYSHVWEGNFINEGDKKLIPYSLVKESIERTPIYEESPIIAGLDVARFGDDRSVLFIRKGNEVITYFQWKGKGAVELCQLVSNEILNHGIDVLVVDCAGVGGGTFDLLKDTVNTCRLVEFNGTYSAENAIYLNARIETYERLKEWLKAGRLPKDDDLINELITLEYDFKRSTQQKFLEPKEDLKKRLGKSPDLADALSMTFFVKKAGGKKNLKNFKRGSAWT